MTQPKDDRKEIRRSAAQKFIEEHRKEHPRERRWAWRGSSVEFTYIPPRSDEDEDEA